MLSFITLNLSEKSPHKKISNLSGKSMPRLLKNFKSTSGSQSFNASDSCKENFEGKVIANSSELDSDQEFFSCENTGASSPAVQTKRFRALHHCLGVRSYSFHNIHESKIKDKRLPKRKTRSSLKVHSEAFELAKKYTITLSSWDDGPDRQAPAENFVVTKEMDAAMQVLHSI